MSTLPAVLRLDHFFKLFFAALLSPDVRQQWDSTPGICDVLCHNCWHCSIVFLQCCFLLMLRGTFKPLNIWLVECYTICRPCCTTLFNILLFSQYKVAVRLLPITCHFPLQPNCISISLISKAHHITIAVSFNFSIHVLHYFILFTFSVLPSIGSD